MKTITKERNARRVKTMHASQDVLTFAGRESDECPLCAMYDYTPNAETIEAIRETHDKHNLHKYSLNDW